MDKYLKQKIVRALADPADKRVGFLEGRNELIKSPVKMNSDFADDVVKDLSVDKIKTEFTPIKNAAEAQAEIAKKQALTALNKGKQPVEDVLDYSQWLKKPKATNLPEKTINYNDIRKDYAAMKKAGKGVGKLGVMGGLLAAGLAGTADEAFANAVIPGGLEGAGAGSDLSMQDDTPKLEMLSQSATDPEVRRAALLELKNRR